MRLTALMKLDPEAAEELRKKGVEGDRTAGRLFLLYAVWRQIDSVKGYSKRAKVKFMAALESELEITWRTASS